MLAVAATLSTLPGSPAEAGVRSADPRRATLRLEDIKPQPGFPEVRQDEPAHIDAELRRLYEKAGAKFDAQLWADAASLLQKCIRHEPGFVDARILLARTALRQGDSKLASRQLRTALEYCPRDPAIHQLLGEMAWQRGNTSETISHLRLAISACEHARQPAVCILARLTLALALEKMGYLSAAASQLEAYLAAVDSADEALLRYRELVEVIALYRGKAGAMLGDLRSSLGQHEAAAKAYERAISAEPTDFLLREKRAMALARSGQLDAALRCMAEAPASTGDPSSRFALLKRLCEAAGVPERYQSELERIAEQSNDSTARSRLAEDLIASRDDEAAARVLENQVRAHPEDEKSWIDLANVYLRLNYHDRLVQTISRLLTRAPSAYRAADTFVQALVKHPQAEDIRDQAARHAEQNSDSPPAAWLQAALIAAADPQQAEASLNSIRSRNPDFAPALISLARLHSARADWPAVLKLVDDANAAGISGYELYLLRGRAYEALDDMKAAEKSLLEAFRLDKSSAVPLFLLAEAADHRREFDKAEQLHRRILEDVDPGFLPSRVRLCRFYINNNRVSEAGDLLEEADSLGLRGPHIERCKAHLALSGAQGDRIARLKDYAAALDTILEKHPEDVDTMIDLANARLQMEKFDAAIPLAEKALSIDPLNYLAAGLKAQIQFRLSRSADAAETVKQVLKQRPNDLVYLQMLLELSFELDDFNTAAATINKILEKEIPEPARAALILRLIEVLHLDGKSGDAVVQARNWMQDAPSEPARRQIYLQALVEADRNDEAIETAHRWLKAAPADDLLRAQYVEQLRLAGRFEAAKHQVLLWLAENPDDYGLNVMLIQLACLTKDWDSAVAAAQQGMEIPQHRAGFENWLGQVYLYARRFDEAIEFYRDRAHNSSAELHQRELINALVTAERFVEAEKIAGHLLREELARRDANLKHDPSLILRMRTILAQIYQRADQPRKAITQLEELYKLLPDEAGINNDLGYTYADMGINLEKAESMIRSALADRPREPAYLDSLGWVLYKQGKFDQALPILRRAVRLQRSAPDPVLVDHLGDALYRNGQGAEAKESWEKALRLRDEKDTPPNSEERAVFARIEKKLKQLEKDEPVETAPVAETGGKTEQSGPQ